MRDDLAEQWDVIYQLAVYLFDAEMDDMLSVDLDEEFIDSITEHGHDSAMVARFEAWLANPPREDAQLAADVQAFLAVHRARPELGDPEDDIDPLYALVTNTALYDTFAYDLDHEAVDDPLLLQMRSVYFEQVASVVGDDDDYDDDTAPFAGMPDAQNAVREIQRITIDNDLSKRMVEDVRKSIAARYKPGGRFVFEYDDEDVLIGFDYTYGQRLQLNAFMMRDALEDYITYDVEGAPPRVVYRDLPDGFYVVELAPHHLREESRKLGNCVGQLKVGYADAIRQGRTRMFSLRTADGRPKFNIEYAPERGAVVQVKGKADRLPKKPYELAMLAKFIEDYLDDDPRDVTDMAAYRPSKYATPTRWNPGRRRPSYSFNEPWFPREW
jgi:SAM-dependent methyltransferase